MSTRILLFYSNKCQHSRQFLKDTQQIGITTIHKVCIDNTPRERIPSVVTSVPALVFSGNNECLQGEKAFMWLKQQTHHKQQNTQKQQQPQQGNIMQTTTPGSGSSGPSEPRAWQSTEMGSTFSDSYSFIDNSFTETGVGQPSTNGNGGSGSTIPKNFAFISTPKTINTDTQQPYQNMNNMKRSGTPSGYGQMPPTATMAPPSNRPETDELSKRMENFRVSRDQDVPQHVQRLA
jgi:hypothetical protein